MSDSAEVPFISGMEREQICETTVRVGKKIFVLDGMLTRVLEKAKMAMVRPDRDEPPVDYARDDDDIRRLCGMLERIMQRPPDNGYREGPRESKNSSIKAVILGCTIAILSAGIIGGIALSNEFSALRAQVLQWQISTDRRLDNLERRP